jgi:hypothetical protein
LREYRRKRLALLRSKVHLLEIDLLRKGERPPLEKPLPDVPYFAVLSRVERRPVADVWPIRLQEVLPILPTPLLDPDPDVPLELGRAVAAVSLPEEMFEINLESVKSDGCQAIQPLFKG